MQSSFPVRIIISVFSVAVIAGAIYYANNTLPSDTLLKQLADQESLDQAALMKTMLGIKDVAYASLIIAASSFAIILILIHQLNVTTSLLKKHSIDD